MYCAFKYVQYMIMRYPHSSKNNQKRGCGWMIWMRLCECHSEYGTVSTLVSIPRFLWPDQGGHGTIYNLVSGANILQSKGMNPRLFSMLDLHMRCNVR